MAWANKYRFRFDSVHGVEYNIYILKDGYSGQVIQRHLGRAPILKKQENGPICGTSLELYAECAVDGEFAELYTSNPKEYKVEVYRAGTLIWFGFVSTELYSEPSIAPPYDVQIVATDGLGELKLNDFAAMGEASIESILNSILSYTGSTRGVYWASNLRHTGGTRYQMPLWTINLDFMAGKTCYEVLKNLMDTIHATITAYGEYWLIARETDISSILSVGGVLQVVSDINGTIDSAYISYARKSVGKMGVADAYPKGYLSTAIEPARKRLSVTSPWHFKPYCGDADMTETPSSYWVCYDDVRKLADRSGYLFGWNVGDPSGGTLTQDIPMSFIDCELIFTVRVKMVHRVTIYAEYNGYVGSSKGWFDSYSYVDNLITEGGRTRACDEDYSIKIPKPIQTLSGGVLRLVIDACDAEISSAKLEINRSEKGFRDSIFINNGSRGEEDEVELLSSRVLSNGVPNVNYYEGLWKYSGNLLYSFADSHNSNGDYMSIQALSRAVSVARTRLRTKGVIDFPSSFSQIPLLITFENEDAWLETWELDLKNEDLTISSISLPTGNVSVESEVVEPIENSSNGSSSGGGGGSSAVLNSYASLLDVWRSLTNNDDLDDYGASTPIVAAHLSSLFTEVTSGQTKYLKENTAYAGLVSDGYITAGAAASASDARLKEKIRTIQPEKALMILAALRGCEWVWNDKYQSLAGQRGSGLIAQEVQSIMPWAVLNFNDELSLNYNSFWGIAIPVMQSLLKMIEKLERRTEKLEKEVKDLKNK